MEMQKNKLLEMIVTYRLMLEKFANIFRRQATTPLLKGVRLNYGDPYWTNL
jgi:hypothetical protein